jgi:CTP:molybdopterin cytidylyltransferase MocA
MYFNGETVVIRQIQKTPAVRINERGSRIEIACCDWWQNPITTSAMAALATINAAFGTMNTDASPGTKTNAQRAGTSTRNFCASVIARSDSEFLVEMEIPEMGVVGVRGK